MVNLANNWINFKRNISAILDIPTIGLSFFEYLLIHNLVKGKLT